MKIKQIAGVVSAALLAMAAPVANAGLIGLYEFENGDAADTSGQGNSGTVLGGVSFVTDSERGNVAEFAPLSGASGIDTGIDVDGAANPAVTFGGWFLHSEYGNISKTLSGDDGGFDRTLGIDTRGAGPNNEVSAFTGSGVLGGGFVPALNEWYFSAVSYSGSQVNLYVNGLLSGTAVEGGSVSSNTLTIGANPGFNEDLIGRADDVFVFDEVLSGDAIRALYDQGLPSEPPPTQAPAPATLALFGLGLAGLSWSRRKK